MTEPYPNGHASENDYRYAPVPEWILTHPQLSAQAVRVYGVLRRHGTTPDRCYPSHQRIAQLARIGARSVPRYITELEAVGAALRAARPGSSNGYHLADPERLDPAQWCAGQTGYPALWCAPTPRTSGVLTKATERELLTSTPETHEKADQIAALAERAALRLVEAV